MVGIFIEQKIPQNSNKFWGISVNSIHYYRKYRGIVTRKPETWSQYNPPSGS